MARLSTLFLDYFKFDKSHIIFYAFIITDVNIAQIFYLNTTKAMILYKNVVAKQLISLVCEFVG